jgi:hypothetical protein
MKRILIGALLLTGLAAATPLVKRELISIMEASLKGSFQSHEMEIFSLPRGMYVEGTGIVLTADVSLAYAPIINPFQQTIPKEVQERIHTKELAQLPILRGEMKKILLNSSASLDTLPMNELIVVGVSITHQKWEDRTGIPSEIIMQGQRAKLLEAQQGKAAPDAVIKVQEQ